MWRDLRDLSFAAVGPELGQRAKSIQSDYKSSKVGGSVACIMAPFLSPCSANTHVCHIHAEPQTWGSCRHAGRACRAWLRKAASVHTQSLTFKKCCYCLRKLLHSLPVWRRMPVLAPVQAAERSLSELKEFAAQLKALPHIQRHIGLAEAVNRAIAAPAFRQRVAIEQQLLDGHGIDAAAEAIDVSMAACTPRARAPAVHSVQSAQQCWQHLDTTGTPYDLCTSVPWRQAVQCAHECKPWVLLMSVFRDSGHTAKATA